MKRVRPLSIPPYLRVQCFHPKLGEIKCPKSIETVCLCVDTDVTVSVHTSEITDLPHTCCGCCFSRVYYLHLYMN